MKTLVDILTIIFVIMIVVLVVSAALTIGASIEHANPFAVDDMDKVVGASFLIVVFLAILLVFYQEGMRIGKSEEEKDEANGTE